MFVLPFIQITTTADVTRTSVEKEVSVKTLHLTESAHALRMTNSTLRTDSAVVNIIVLALSITYSLKA